MNTAGSSHRSPSLPKSSDSAIRAEEGSDVDRRVEADDQTVISQRPPLASTAVSRPAGAVELGKLLAGERLNHFELLEYVGGGGMGAVFRALDTMLNREVALKVLSRDQGADEETRRRFQNEAQSAARLDHENIARVYYVGEDKGLNYIVFEFIEGVNLRESVEQRGPLPLAEAISYTLQVAEALAHACSRDVVHRDIKPSNLIITQDGRAKLVDMGLARLHQVHTEGEDLTASGVTLGTFDYISPEQARDPRSADVRSDIYSLGCTVYFMLTGRPPFPEGTVLQKLLQHNSDAPPDPRELNPDLPPEASEVIRKMLAKDPRRRFQHPSELITELYLLAELIGCPTPTPTRPPWLATPPAPRLSLLQRHLPWIIPVAALLGIVVLLDRWQTGEPTDEEFNPPGQGESSLVAPRAVAAAGASRRTSAASDRKPATHQAADISSRAPRSTSANAPGLPPEAGRIDPVMEDSDDPAMRASDVATSAADNRSPASPDRGDSPDGERPQAASGAKTAAADVADTASKPVAIGASGSNASESLSSKPAGDAPSVKPPLEEIPAGVLVVCDEVGPQRYPSLRAACAAARSGDVIELRYDGRKEETPISLENSLRLTIRSHENSHPVVVFKPGDADPYAFPHSMFHVGGGELKLVNVAVELELPQDAPSEDWSLIEAQLVQSLTLEKCLLTIKNASDRFGAYHDKVSFFQLKAAPGADAMMPKGMMSIPPAEIRLEDCAVRGEAVFLRNDDAQPVRLSWKNGLFVSSEWLLSAGGATNMPSASSGGPGKIQLELEHLTAATGQGLCRMWNSASAPGLLDLEIHCTDSVLLPSSDSAVLIEQTCVEQASESQRRISWEGDRNVYGGFSAFWRIGDANMTSAQITMPFEAWKLHWSGREVQPSTSSIPWKRSAPVSAPPHACTVADYVIDERSDNAAIATDGAVVGMNLSVLPAWLWGTDRTAASSADSDALPPELD